MKEGTFSALPIGTRFLDGRGVMWLKLSLDAAQCIDVGAEEHGVILNAVHYFSSGADVYTA